LNKKMNKKDSEPEQYYQTIARLLFRLRGAPFILSAREIDVIEEWEHRCIPLNTVLEGMKSAYGRFRRDSRTRNFTLAFCQRFVLNAFHMHRERKIGKRGRKRAGSERVETVKHEVKKFIDHIPEPVSYLKEHYLEILDDLSLNKIDEDTLESRDDQIDQMLLEHASPDEIETHRQKAAEEFSVNQEAERNQIAKKKFIKEVREKYKIPYVSLFYY